MEGSTTNQTTTNQTTTNQPTTPGGPQGPDVRDWQAEARKWERRAKDNKAKADDFDRLKEESDAAAAKAREALASAEAERDQLRASLERASLVARVSQETGVPTSLLHGDDEQAMRAEAEAINAFAASAAPGYPIDKGGSSGGSPVTRQSIEAIRDPVARVRARAKHADLYN